jgi:hypothetical protein
MSPGLSIFPVLKRTIVAEMAIKTHVVLLEVNICAGVWPTTWQIPVLALVVASHTKGSRRISEGPRSTPAKNPGCYTPTLSAASA